MIFKGEFQGKTNKFLLSDISLKNYNPGMNIWDTSMLQNFDISRQTNWQKVISTL